MNVMTTNVGTAQQIQRIKTLIQKYNVAINPVLKEEEVLEVEKELGTELPEGYRQFLLEVGNGGMGPYYGMHSLQKEHLEILNGNRASKRLQMCHEGYGYFFSLVIEGSDKSYMYHESSTENTMKKLYFGFGEYSIPYTFLDWYEHWVKSGAKMME